MATWPLMADPSDEHMRHFVRDTYAGISHRAPGVFSIRFGRGWHGRNIAIAPGSWGIVIALPILMFIWEDPPQNARQGSAMAVMLLLGLTLLYVAAGLLLNRVQLEGRASGLKLWTSPFPFRPARLWSAIEVERIVAVRRPVTRWQRFASRRGVVNEDYQPWTVEIGGYGLMPVGLRRADAEALAADLTEALLALRIHAAEQGGFRG